MSANLDLVSSLYAAWERGDYTSVEWADPDIEWVRAEDLEPRSWKGLAEMEAGLREVLSAWQDHYLEAEEYRELDLDRVLVLAQFIARGKRSGVDVALSGATLLHIRESKVTRLVVYGDRERAFADLGLAPERDSADAPD
jgi:ketosteroid isomerase-like protein